MLVNVRYSGKRLPWTIKMPWLSVPEVTFGATREAVMEKADAERLCAENPTDWKIIGVVDSEPETIMPDKPQPPESKKPVPPKKKRKAVKKE